MDLAKVPEEFKAKVVSCPECVGLNPNMWCDFHLYQFDLTYDPVMQLMDQDKRTYAKSAVNRIIDDLDKKIAAAREKNFPEEIIEGMDISIAVVRSHLQ